MRRIGLTELSAALVLGAVLAGEPPTAAAQTGQQAGVAGAVLGKVSQISYQNPKSTVGRTVGSGDVIRLGDRIVTGPRGRLQILLLDQSTFTIGPNASMVIDSFVYDPKSGNGRMGATITRGVFRFVSGRISRTNPQGVNIKTPVATIGVRGTTVVGQVGGTIGGATGLAGRFALTGVGPLNNTQFGKSWLIVGGPAGLVGGTRLTRSGFMIDVSGAGRRSRALRLDQTWFRQVTALLVGRGIPPDGVTTQDRNRALVATGQGLAKGFRLSASVQEGILAKNRFIDPTNDIASSNPMMSGVYYYGEDFVDMTTTNPINTPGEGYAYTYMIDFGARNASGTLYFFNGGGLNGPLGSVQVNLTGNPVTDRTAIIRQIQALPGFANATIDVKFVLGPNGLNSVVTVTQQNGSTTTTSTGGASTPPFSQP